MEKTWVDENGKTILGGSGSEVYDGPSEDEQIYTYYDIVYNLNTKIQASIL
jgi:hypothetical protein